MQTIRDLLIQQTNCRNIYLSPPSRLSYPCIVVSESRHDNRYGDGIKYSKHKMYSLTIIDPDPLSDIPNLVNDLQYCEFERYYTVNGLNHWIYNIFYHN